MNGSDGLALRRPFRQFAPSLETLETRFCPTVSVVASGHTLLIQGDDSANRVSITDNGSAGGELTGVQIGTNGVVTGQYSNGGTQDFGTIALANFTNPQGLVPTSGNDWTATTASGPATTGAPGTAALGQLESGALEGSNVDLSSQLVNLITAQQAYQANVQSINTEQQNFQRLLTIQ